MASPLSFWRSIEQRLVQHRVSRHLNAWYFWGAILLTVLVLQLLSGFFLLMHYVPSALPNARGWSLAFASVFDLMHAVPWGWFIRYMHTTGASLLFVALYMHMTRGFLYGSYQGRSGVWCWGVTLFLLFALEAFCGYLLPWGQMSYWSARVITHLVALVPVVGPELFRWLFGESAMHTEMLHRFFALHVFLLPLLFLAIVVAHIRALWQVGSSDPDGRPFAQQSTIPFHPYYTVKDLSAVMLFLVVYFMILFFQPTMGGLFIDPQNALDANPLVTPTEIHPVWYFMPFYSMLRAVTHGFLAGFTGLLFVVLALSYRLLRWPQRCGLAVLCIALAAFFHQAPNNLVGGFFLLAAPLILYAVPWLDAAPVASWRYRPWQHRMCLVLLLMSFVTLGVLGYQDATPLVIHSAAVCTMIYFAFFLLMPYWSRLGTCRWPQPA